MERRMLLAAAPLLLTGATVAVAAEPRPGRTYYDRLKLDTPDEAAATFVAAYAAADYPTVFLVLAVSTQEAVTNAIMGLDFGPLLAFSQGDSENLLHDAMPTLTGLEQTDTSWMFDAIMQAGARHGVLPVTLRPAAALKPASGESPSVEVADPSGPVTIRLSRSAAGRWRVVSAMPPSRNPARPPWGLPLSI